MWKDKEKAKRYWKERYSRVKKNAVSALGGKCSKCGSISSLEFDHIDPATKVDNFTVLACIAGRGEEELAKCQLLCKECHRDKTGRAEHGSLGMYRHQKCRCDLCRKANSTYHRERRKKLRLSRQVERR